MVTECGSHEYVGVRNDAGRAGRVAVGRSEAARGHRARCAAPPRAAAAGRAHRRTRPRRRETGLTHTHIFYRLSFRKPLPK